ncbi:MAG: GNAT family N-acetyltransferase [Thermoplasmata archaeon]|nr:GNAT family N-acetyltransferase [Thermoplasmata archaeon]
MMESWSSENVTLRPPTPEDAELLASLRNDLRTQGWNQRLPPMRTPEAIKEKLKEIGKKPNTAFLMIDTKEDGAVGYVDYSEDPPRWGASIGIITGVDYWGKGYAQEAIELLLEFLFEERGLQVIWAWTQAGNKAAMKAGQKLGFKVSTRVREGTIMYGEIHDTLLMDMLREEYYESRGKEDRVKGGSRQ